jgi:hypothetical protein
MTQFPPSHNTPGIPELTTEENRDVEKAKAALASIRKTFEFWIDIARGLDALRQKADKLPGFKAGYAFAQLREREGLGESVLDKTRVSKLGKILANLPAIEAWRGELTEKERTEWASPEAVCNRFPEFVKERKLKKETEATEGEAAAEANDDEEQSEEQAASYAEGSDIPLTERLEELFKPLLALCLNRGAWPKLDAADDMSLTKAQSLLVNALKEMKGVAQGIAAEKVSTQPSVTKRRPLFLNKKRVA